MEGGHAGRPSFAPILVCVQEIDEAISVPGDDVAHEDTVGSGRDGDGPPGGGLSPWTIPFKEPKAFAVEDARDGRIPRQRVPDPLGEDVEGIGGEEVGQVGGQPVAAC